MSQAPLKLCLVISAALGLSSVVAIGMGLSSSPAAWFTITFEAMVLFAAGFGILLGLGRFAEGRSITLLCIAGCVVVSSALGYRGCDGQLLGVSLKFALVARLLAAAALAVLAASLVLSATPTRSIGLLARGSALLAPPLLLLVLHRRGSTAALNSLPGGVSTALWGLILLICAIMAAIGAHLIIRAFETALEHEQQHPESPRV